MIQLEAWSETTAELTEAQAAALAGTGLATVSVDAPPRWRISTESRIGVLMGPYGEIRVMPRLAVPQLMFLLSYAGDPRGWRHIGPTFDVDDDLFSAVATAFAVHAERALSPAPMRGYVTIEDRTTTLRGRVRIAEQLAHWPGMPIPLEVSYDDFTADVAENRMVRGAAELLLRLPLVRVETRRRLLRVRATLEDVSPHPPTRTAKAPPRNRLNARYGPALSLAELVLRGASITAGAGAAPGIQFSFDMNRVFEDFLTTALRAAIERQAGGRVEAQKQNARLDAERMITLKPDLTWMRHGSPMAVIDAKYKALGDKRLPNADAYQMLAYCTALELDRGYLVYAKAAGETDRTHTINHVDKTIVVRAVDVEKSPTAVLEEIDRLAASITGEASALSMNTPNIRAVVA